MRHFVTARLEHIARRFVKKTGAAPPGLEDVDGYKSMGELCKDLEGLINIVWLSGTRKRPLLPHSTSRDLLTPLQPAYKYPTY